VADWWHKNQKRNEKFEKHRLINPLKRENSREEMIAFVMKNNDIISAQVIGRTLMFDCEHRQ